MQAVQTVGMDDLKMLPPGATAIEQSLPPDWRDTLYRKLGLHRQFVADVIEVAFGNDWVGSLRLADLRLEPTLTSKTGHKNGFNEIAWSTILLLDRQDEAPEPMRIHVVIGVQGTVQHSMPFRVMQNEGMRYQHLQDGPGPVPRIQMIILYTGEVPWDLSASAGQLVYDGVLVELRTRVSYTLVDLQRLRAKPGTKNLLLLLAGVVRGKTMGRLAVAADALAGRLAELGDVTLEQDMFELLRAQGKDRWPELDWSCCASLADMVRLLESEISWPEKWKAQMLPGLEAEVEAEVKAELKAEVEARFEREERTKIAARVEPEVRTEVAARVLPEIEARLEAELRPKIEERLRERIRAGRRVR